MKTVCYLDAECPECPKLAWNGSPLPPANQSLYANLDGTVECLNPHCKLFQVKFKRPGIEVELERI